MEAGDEKKKFYIEVEVERTQTCRKEVFVVASSLEEADEKAHELVDKNPSAAKQITPWRTTSGAVTSFYPDGERRTITDLKQNHKIFM